MLAVAYIQILCRVQVPRWPTNCRRRMRSGSPVEHSGFATTLVTLMVRRYRCWRTFKPHSETSHSTATAKLLVRNNCLRNVSTDIPKAEAERRRAAEVSAPRSSCGPASRLKR